MADYDLSNYQGNAATAAGTSGVLGGTPLGDISKDDRSLDAFDKLQAYNFAKNKQLHDDLTEQFKMLQDYTAKNTTFDFDGLDPHDIEPALKSVEDYKKWLGANPESILWNGNNTQSFLEKQKMRDELNANFARSKANWILSQKEGEQKNLFPEQAQMIDDHMQGLYKQPWDQRVWTPAVPQVNYQINDMSDYVKKQALLPEPVVRSENGYDNKYAYTPFDKILSANHDILTGVAGTSIPKDQKGNGVPLKDEAMHFYNDYHQNFQNNPDAMNQELQPEVDKYNTIVAQENKMNPKAGYKPLTLDPKNPLSLEDFQNLSMVNRAYQNTKVGEEANPYAKAAYEFGLHHKEDQDTEEWKDVKNAWIQQVQNGNRNAASALDGVQLSGWGKVVNVNPAMANSKQTNADGTPKQNSTFQLISDDKNSKPITVDLSDPTTYNLLYPLISEQAKQKNWKPDDLRYYGSPKSAENKTQPTTAAPKTADDFLSKYGNK